MTPQFGKILGFILIDLVSVNAYFVQINYENPWFSGIWIEEQSIDTNENKRNNEVEWTKKKKLMDRLAHCVSPQTTIFSPNVPTCQSLKDKIK